jgi:NADH-quinone oxidoreductase subunit L
VESWEPGFTAPMIRWIALLPCLAAVVHGILIGLMRARIASRSLVAISLSALTASFLLSAVSLFDLVASTNPSAILDRVALWIGGGVGPRSFSAELTFQFDPLSGVFCFAVTSVALAIHLYATGQLRSGQLDPEVGHRTFAMLDLLVGSTLVLVLADNLLLFFLGWAGVGLATHLFASFAYERREVGRAGAAAFVIGRIGDLGLLGAMLMLFDGLARAGAPALTFRGIEAAFRLLEGQGVLWLAYGGEQAPLLLEIVGFGLVLAAMTKCAQFPLHLWLPHAANGPPAASAAIQSITTVLAGVYVLLRFAFLLESAPGALRSLIMIGTLTMVVTSLGAATQRALSRLLSLTTSCLLGLVLIGVGLGAYSTAAFLLLTHGFAKALLVLTAGVVQAALNGEDDLWRMGGLALRMRLTQGLFGLGALALIGVPPLADFFPVEELLAFLQVSERPESELVLGSVLFSLMVLAYAIARGFFLVFQGNVKPGGLVEPRLNDPIGWRQHSLIALAVMAVLGGLLTPAQFWAELLDAPTQRMDSVGHFLTAVIPGAPDPELGGGERGRLLAALLAALSIGAFAAAGRYARQGVQGEPQHPLAVKTAGLFRETFHLEVVIARLFLQPLRGLSRVALERGIEGQLIDRLVVSGSVGLVRRTIWVVLRRIQNGRLQSYMLLGLLTVVVVVSWMMI